MDSTGHRFALVCATVALVVALSLTLREPQPSLLFDDSYITLHSAGVMLSGDDPNYGVNAFVGATSPVHLALVTLFGSFFGLESGAIVVGCLGLGLFEWGLALYCVRRGCKRSQTVAVVVVGSLSGLTPLMFTNGLETGLGLAVGVWLVVLSESAVGGRGFWLLAAASAFVRPELGLLAFFLAASTWPGRACLKKWLLGAALSFCAFAALWMALYSATGATVLDTARAKMAFFAEGGFPLVTKFAWVGGALGAFFLVCGAPLLCVIGAVCSKALKAYFLWIVAIVCVAFMRFPGSLNHNYNRYLYVLVPLFAMGAAQLLPLVTATVKKFDRVVSLVLILSALTSLPNMAATRDRALLETRAALAPTAEWCNKNLSPDARLLVHDAGYIAYATDYEIVDIVGLKRPPSAALHGLLTLRSNGDARTAVVSQIAMESGATHLVMLDDWDRIFQVASGLRAIGWRLEPVYESRYSVYKMTRP